MSLLTPATPVETEQGPTPGHARRGSLHLPLTGTPVRIRTLVILACLLATTLVLGVVAIGLGDYPIAPQAVLHALVHDDGFISTMVRDWRAPRVVAAIAFGAALATSGAIFQSLTRNPLGSPDIIGFTTGAYTGVLVAVTVLPGLGVPQGPFTSTACGALVGGLATAATIYLLAWRDGIQGLRLVVVGIGVTAILHAVNLYLLLRAQEEVAMAASIWGAGSLSVVSWGQVFPALIGFIILAPVTSALTPALRQLELGDDAARAHGLRIQGSWFALMGTAVCLVAVVTAVAGPIAFVALAAPQIAHRLLRDSGIPLLGSALVGGLLLLVADLCAQHLLGSDVPVGIVTVVTGGLYLLVLLVRRSGQ